MGFDTRISASEAERAAKKKEHTAAQKAWQLKLTQARERVEQKARERAEAGVSEQVNKMQKALAAAKKRARAKESAAHDCAKQRRLKTTAQRALKELQLSLEEEPEGRRQARGPYHWSAPANKPAPRGSTKWAKAQWKARAAEEKMFGVAFALLWTPSNKTTAQPETLNDEEEAV